MANIHSQLGELDEARASGTRALEIAGRVGDLRLRTVTASQLQIVHYRQGEYERVVELATDNLAAVPADWTADYATGTMPASIHGIFLVMSLAQLGRFAEATEHAAEAIRLAELTQHPFPLANAHRSAGTLHVIQGAWATARARFERMITVLRTGNVVQLLATAVTSSSWVLAQLGEGAEALNRIEDGEQLVEQQVSGGIVGNLGSHYHALGRASLILGRLDEARRFADRAIESSTSNPGFRAWAQHVLGDIATHPERFDAASGEDYYRKSLALAEPRGTVTWV
jgi:tetratricopeptide (TPR) repeat protein